MVIRKATRSDIPGMLALVRELAAYERAPEQVIVDIDAMEAYWDQNIFQAHVAVEDDAILGVAIYFVAYSTWKGKIIYLDDLVVTESRRRSGAGQLLWEAVVNHCKELGVNQLRWHVLEWNDPAINFYRKLGATLDPEWIMGKLEREDLRSGG